MDINLIFKIAMLIIVIGLAIKALKFVSGFVFKIALVVFILLLVYKMFI